MTTLLISIDFIKEFANQYGYGVFIPMILTAVFMVLLFTAGFKHIIIPGAKELLGIRPNIVGFYDIRNNIPMLIEEFEGLK